MKQLLMVLCLVLISQPAWASNWCFATDVSWHHCPPGCGSWRHYWWEDPWCCPWPRTVWVKKSWPSVAEQKQQESETKRKRLEKARVQNETYREKHGHYPIPKVVFSPNHPEAMSRQEDADP